jgi:predicted ATPase
MITQIEIENFKCFKNRVSFPLRMLTLLTGINGRGKSTLLQSLLLMRQSIEHNPITTQVLFNGNCVNLNSFDDIRNRNTLQSEAVIFKYHYDFFRDPLKSNGYIEFSLSRTLEDDMIAQVSQITLFSKSELTDKVDISIGSIFYIPDNNKTLLHNVERIYYPVHEPDEWFTYKNSEEEILTKLINLLPSNFNYVNSETEGVTPYDSPFKEALNFYHIHYVSADRIGPKDFYPKSTLDKFPNVGARGEFTTNLLYKEQDKLVDDRLCLGEDAKTLITQTEAWLSKIFGGAKLEIPSSKSSVLELLFNTSASKDRFKPANVGFGFNSVLPIIVSGLIAKEGEILIVENPEIHLHPRAQSELTKFLAKVSSCGVQVLVESHSDHILNGLRIAVLDKIIDSKDLSILYFQNNLENPVVQIPVKSDGGIEEWPDDFFDQTSKDFERLFGI